MSRILRSLALFSIVTSVSANARGMYEEYFSIGNGAKDIPSNIHVTLRTLSGDAPSAKLKKCLDEQRANIEEAFAKTQLNDVVAEKMGYNTKQKILVKPTSITVLLNDNSISGIARAGWEEGYPDNRLILRVEPHWFGKKFPWDTSKSACDVLTAKQIAKFLEDYENSMESLASLASLIPKTPKSYTEEDVQRAIEWKMKHAAPYETNPEFRNVPPDLGPRISNDGF